MSIFPDKILSRLGFYFTINNTYRVKQTGDMQKEAGSTDSYLTHSFLYGCPDWDVLTH